MLYRKPDERSWHEHLLELLKIGASIEHALMVQYLYAAYSLRDVEWPKVNGRDTLLAIAREEMAHLLTVQNVLALLGGPIHLGREDFPWDVLYSPFPFQLERLSRGSLACYAYAEMPRDICDDSEEKTLCDEITKDAMAHIQKQVGYKKQGHHVGILYEDIIEILADHKRIPDSRIIGSAGIGQMSWDEWGRSYIDDDDMTGTKSSDDDDEMSNITKSNDDDDDPGDLIIEKVTTREQALVALAKLAEQGEGRGAAKQINIGENSPVFRAIRGDRFERDNDDTHFGRLCTLYEFLARDNGREGDELTWEVPTNPTSRTGDLSGNVILEGAEATNGMAKIESKRSQRWAELFNIRYRMLLTWLIHALILARTGPSGNQFPLSGQIVHRAFGEMYNMKAIAQILVQLPLRDDQPEGTGPRAGPPFEMPPDLELPPNDRDIWQTHMEAIKASDELCDDLLGISEGSRPGAAARSGLEIDDKFKGYLYAMKQTDNDACEWINNIRAGRQ